MKRLISLCACLIFSASAYGADGRVGAFFVPTLESDPDLALDMTLALTGALVGASGEKAVPYDEIARELGFVNMQNPGECIGSEACLAEVHSKMKLSVLVIGYWTDLDDSRVRIKLKRVNLDPLQRFTRIREIPNDPLKIAQNLTEMAREMVNPPSSILVVSGSGEIEVEIDGAVVGIGPGTFMLSPGRRTIILRQNGQEVLNSQIACPIGLTCSAEIPGELPNQNPVQVGAGSTRTDAPTRVTDTRITPWLRYGGYTSTALGASLLVLALLESNEMSAIEDRINAECNPIGPDGQAICENITASTFEDWKQQGEDHASKANIYLLTGGVLTLAGIGLVLYDMFRPEQKSTHVGYNSSLRHLSAFRLDFGHGATWIRHRIDF